MPNCHRLRSDFKFCAKEKHIPDQMILAKLIEECKMMKIGNKKLPVGAIDSRNE